MQLLEVVTAHSQFLSHFSIPQAMPTQPVEPVKDSPAGGGGRNGERIAVDCQPMLLLATRAL